MFGQTFAAMQGFDLFLCKNVGGEVKKQGNCLQVNEKPLPLHRNSETKT